MLWFKIMQWMVWRGIFYGSFVGPLFGIGIVVVNLLNSEVNFQMSIAFCVLGLMYGCFFGVIGGLILGLLSGVTLALQIRLFFYPPQNWEYYRRWLRVATTGVTFVGGLILIRLPLSQMQIPFTVQHEVIPSLMAAGTALYALNGLPEFAALELDTKLEST